jgi:hypothetical protein
MDRQREAERARMVAQYRSDIRPVIEDLQQAGFGVDSLEELKKIGSDHWRLVGSTEYDRALPILIEHLRLPYSDQVATVLGAAVAVPGAQPYWQDLKSLYLTEIRRQPKEQLAYALAVSASEDNVDELIDLLRDDSNGESRVYLLLAFDRRAVGYRAVRQARFATVAAELQLDPQLERAIEGLHWSSRPHRRASRHEVTKFDAGGLTETSASIDLGAFYSILNGLVDLGIGFRKTFGREIRSAVKALEPEEEARFAFELGDDLKSPLFVTVHMDDVDSPDVWFFAPAPVIGLISRLIEGVLGFAVN